MEKFHDATLARTYLVFKAVTHMGRADVLNTN
jgi:hypothetical protein